MQPTQYPIYPIFDNHECKCKIDIKHIKEVKKGIFIKFEDGTWEFIATDDDCFKKIKEVLKDEL